MVLVEYPDSESDTEHSSRVDIGDEDQKEPSAAQHDNSRKRKAGEQDVDAVPRSKLPPLPSSFHSLYASNVRTSTTDDPSLHGGRRRQVPHIQGNWPSHVYLEWFPNKQELEQLDDIILQVCKGVQSKHNVNAFLRSDLGAQLPLHVSLSAPLVLTTEVKDDFLSALTNTINSGKVHKFSVRPSSLDWVSNFDGSRSFLVLRLTTPTEDELNKLLKLCNKTCKQFDLPTLYQEADAVGVGHTRRRVKRDTDNKRLRAEYSETPEHIPNAFHVSIAWTLSKPSEDERNIVQQLNLSCFARQSIEFQAVKIKIGNSIEDVQLA